MRYRFAYAKLVAVSHDESLLTSQQVANLFRVSVSTVSRWARDGDLPALRTPGGRGTLRFLRSDVEQLLATHTPDKAAS